jgi:soluble P-type ATPase
LLKIDVVTFDTFGTARKALRRLPCVVTVLTGGEGSRQKETFLESLGPDRCIAVGNGINDRGMLAKARLGIVVIGDEGAACKALAEADIVVPNIVAALDLLTTPRRILATLRN